MPTATNDPPSTTDPAGATIAFPGSFNPPTVGHLAMAEAAIHASRAARLDLVVSEVALAKEDVEYPRFADRIAVLHAVAESRPWLRVRTTKARLLAELADGYDWLLLGADKWAQINELQWYGGSAASRDASLARLPRLIVVARHDHPVPVNGLVIPVPEAAGVSSTAARSGAHAMMLAEAQEFAERTGAWIDRARYEEWVRGR